MERQDSPEQGAEAVGETILHPADPDEVTPSNRAPDVTPASDLEVAEAESPSFVYALGEVAFRFPSLGLEKEIAQVMGLPGTAGVSDQQAVQAVISEDQNRYLARGLCWVLLVGGLETYILIPRDPADYRLLIEAVREYPRDEQQQPREPGRRPAHVDVVIGALGGMAPPDLCNGLFNRVVFVDQIYSFDRATLIESIPTPDSVSEKDEAQFRDTAGSFFDHIMQMTDNAGATDEHRALNYLAVRYPKIYATVAEEQGRNASLAGIEARPSALSGVRRIVDVLFAFTHRETDVTAKYLARVDVNDEHPFLMTPLSPYYDLQ